MKEVLGLADGRLLVGGLEALGIGPAPQKASHLPIPAGIRPEDSQLGRVVGNGRDCGQDGQSAVPCWEEEGVVCGLCFFPKSHSHKHICS